MNEDLKEPTELLEDSDLVALSERWMKESEEYHGQLAMTQQVAEQYYLGNQTELERVPDYASKAVENHVFMGVETIVPIATSNTPQFVVSPANESEASALLSDAIEAILGRNYEARDVRGKLEQSFRHLPLFRFGVLKIIWNEELDDCDLKVVRPQRIWIPKYGNSVHELPYIIEKVDMTFDEIREFFGEDKLKEVGASRGESMTDRQDMERAVTVWEIWTNKFVFWRYQGTILKKLRNPYFDFEGYEGDDPGVTLFRNHFRSPKKPYIFLTAFKLGNTGPVGSTSLVEQAISIQDVINIHKRAVVDSARTMGNPAWFVDSEVMSEEEAKNQITNEPGLLLYGPGAANPSMVRRDTPPSIPNYIINSQMESQAAFDNIFGTHSTTRGERREPETLGGRLLLKQADIGRIDLLVREIERAVVEIGEWFIQLMKLYYEGERTFKIFGERGVQFITLNRQMIEDGIEITVKAGSTLPTDDISIRQDAITLAQAGLIDPLTLYERMKVPNPEETYQRLLKHLSGQPVTGGQQPVQPGPGPGMQEQLTEARTNIAGGGV